MDESGPVFCSLAPGFEWQNFSTMAVDTLATLNKSLPSYTIAALPVILVRFEIRSSSSLTKGELVARGLVTVVFT